MDRSRSAKGRRGAHLPAALAALLAILASVASGCGGEGDGPRDRGGNGGDSPPPAAPEIPAGSPTVVFLGDSIAAGLHLPRDLAFPAVLQRRLAENGVPFRLVNAGVSGGTTAGGVSRLDWILGQDPDVVVVELGANDGFRGTPLETIERNLREIVRRCREAGAKVLLLGVRLPPNYGPEYVEGFDSLYPRIAEEMEAPFVPYFMEGVAGKPLLNLPDGIHPTPEGHRRLAENVEDALEELLR